MRNVLFASIAVLAMSGSAALAQSSLRAPAEPNRVSDPPEASGGPDWVSHAVISLFDIDFHNAPLQTEAARGLFTAAGWSAYAPARTSLVEAVQQMRMLCHARVQGMPGDAVMTPQPAGYEMALPVVQTCENTDMADSQVFQVTVHVVPADSADHPQGWAIERIGFVSGQ